MVDVGWKSETAREAVARGAVSMQEETLALIKSGGVEKGDVLAVAPYSWYHGCQAYL